MLRIYCAGAYSANGALPVLRNMQRGIQLAVRVARAGMAPYAPWLDFVYGLISDMPLPVFQRIGIEWLRVSDAMVVATGSENSIGTQEERKEASLLGIPVFEETEFGRLVVWAQCQDRYQVDDEYADIIEKWNIVTDDAWRPPCS